MRWHLCAVALPIALATATSIAGAKDMQLFQMMRSLQLVQDRIADGDHAALSMQGKLLGIIDERLRAADPEDFDDTRNLHALLIYGTSGGNPATLDMVVSRLELEGTQQMLSQGVTRYVRGDLAGARQILRDADPSELSDVVAAPVALVIGALLMQEAPTRALSLFDQARLLSPGTLIEEAALRRAISVSEILRDEDRFAMAASQYVRRFLYSPYASQFAEAFVSGVIAMQEDVDLDLIEDVAAQMSAEHAHAIYLRIARKSAIEGYERLLAFASRHVDDIVATGQNPRATLYANIASVTSGNVSEVLEVLESVDTRRLSENDRRLLAAARTVALEIVSPPASGATAGAVPVAGRPLTAGETLADTGPASADFVGETLSRLQAIDKLLEDEEH